jgi:pilus assembly protein CpaB
MQRQSTGGRTRAGIFLVGSILLAALASVIVLSMIKKSKDAAEKSAESENSVEVVVALHDLYMGLPLTEDDVALRKVPSTAVYEGYVFHSVEEVVNRTPRERILGNEFIRLERLADQRAGIGLNAVIATGKRAMTVVTNTEQAVAGLLQAGNYVDIIVAIKPEDPAALNAKFVSETILQGIKVLAVGGQMNSSAPRPKSPDELKGNGKDKTKDKPTVSESQDPKMQAKLKPSITLEVGPDEAEKLALAQTQGDIYVTLRSDTDILEVPADAPVTVASLIGIPAAPIAAPSAAAPPKPDRPSAPKAEPAPDAPPPSTATVVSGSQSTVYEIGDGGKSAEAQNKNKARKPTK